MKECVVYAYSASQEAVWGEPWTPVSNIVGPPDNQYAEISIAPNEYGRILYASFRTNNYTPALPPLALISGLSFTIFCKVDWANTMQITYGGFWTGQFVTTILDDQKGRLDYQYWPKLGRIRVGTSHNFLGLNADIIRADLRNPDYDINITIMHAGRRLGTYPDSPIVVGIDAIMMSVWYNEREMNLRDWRTRR